MTVTTVDGRFNVQSTAAGLQMVENSYNKPKTPVVPLNKADVITLDGQSRDVMVVNRQHPGPVIEVTEGNQVSAAATPVLQ